MKKNTENKNILERMQTKTLVKIYAGLFAFSIIYSTLIAVVDVAAKSRDGQQVLEMFFGSLIHFPIVNFLSVSSMFLCGAILLKVFLAEQE